MHYLYVSLGGILGASARYFIFSLLEQKSTGLPYHTMLVNCTGCFLIGLITEYFAFKGHFPYPAKLFLVTGFLGSFTTFSTYIMDGALLTEKEAFFKAAAYLLFSVVLGFGCYFAAVYGIRGIFGPKPLS